MESTSAYVCPNCNKRFKTLKEFREHLRENYKCKNIAFDLLIRRGIFEEAHELFMEE